MMTDKATDELLIKASFGTESWLKAVVTAAQAAAWAEIAKFATRNHELAVNMARVAAEAVADEASTLAFELQPTEPADKQKEGR